MRTQVAGEQRRLLAALTRLDLDDHVAVVVGIARHEQRAQLVLDGLTVGGEHHHLVAERGVLAGEFARRREVIAQRSHCSNAATTGVSAA